MNVNSEYTFKSSLSKFDNEHILLLQETKLASEEAVNLAKEFAKSAGWLSVFTLAHVNPDTSKPSGGVAVLVGDGLNFGVQPVQLPASCKQHRVAAVRVEVPTLGEFVLGSVYLESGVGLNQGNLTLLAQLAVIQEQEQKTVLFGGGWNLSLRQECCSWIT